MMTASAKRLQVYRDEFLEASKKHNELFELFLLEYRKIVRSDLSSVVRSRL